MNLRKAIAESRKLYKLGYIGIIDDNTPSQSRIIIVHKLSKKEMVE